jgi:alkanesulfonate monooxygenase SsuD/methylene tetrahydromethanopterin reductase-like flavin-dependent oxidoreductase (luciferase family)
VSFTIGITDHLEGPSDRTSGEVYAEVADLMRLADELGVTYAWFAEHHVHAHRGHLPTPLLFALHLAQQTRQIQLGAAVVCLNLHHAVDVAEQVAVADVLSRGRMCMGFGSGSTAEEFELFGLRETDEAERHAQFESSLRTIIESWRGEKVLPSPSADLPMRCWAAVNSLGAARVAGAVNLNVLFSHLRTPEQYRQYTAAYRAAGGTRLIAANRPVFVGENDEHAFAVAEPALRVLWRRFQSEGKIAGNLKEPSSVAELCAHPINFIVGGPTSVARQLRELCEQAPFDVANLEVRWDGLSHEQVRASLTRLMAKAGLRPDR